MMAKVPSFSCQDHPKCDMASFMPIEKYFGRLVRVYLMLITIERKTNGQ